MRMTQLVSKLGKKIAVVQMTADPRGRSETIKKALKFIDEAASRKASLVVLPEVFNMKYSDFVGKYDTKIYERAESIPGPTIDMVAEKARIHEIHIVAPIFEKAMAGEYYDTAALIGPDGKMMGRYRKTHIPGFGIWLERFYFRPGSEHNVFKTPIGTLGMLVCWDRHFPENWRMLTMKGAELIVVPAAIPRFDVETVEYVTRTRALENGVYAAVACRPGNEGSIKYTGSSLIVGPTGKILAKAGIEEETVIYAEIDPKEIENARLEKPFLRDLRSELFGRISA